LILLWLLFSLCAEPWEVHYSQGRILAQKGEWKQAEAEFRLVIGERPAFLPGRLALGTVLEQTEDWTGAEAEFRAALLLDPKSTYGLAQLAQSLMKLQRSSAAIAYWKQAAELEPGNLDFSIGMAAALFESGSIAGAQQTLQALAVAHPGVAKAQFSLGSFYARRGLFAEAADAYQACLKIDPADDEARLAMVKALLALDRHNEALDALRGRREDFDTLLLRGGALRGLGEDERAVADLSRAVQLKPDDYDARYNLGFVLFRLGKAREAKEQLERATQIRPNSTEAHYRLGLVLKNLNESARANEELRQFEQKKKEDLQQTISATALTSGNEMLRKGNLSGAVNRYQEAIRLDPKNALAYYDLALAQARLGEHSAEEQSLRKAIELNPNLALARNQLGLILLGKGKTQEARREFEAGFTADPRCAECQSNLGVLYGLNGDARRAEELFRGALEVDPQYGEAHLNLGLMLARKNQFADAEKELLMVPPTVRSLTGLGMVQTKLGKPDAVETFRQVVSLNPNSAEARLNLGIALADSEKLEAALAEFTEAVRLAPGDPSAHYNRGRVLKDLGRLQEAAPELEAAGPTPDALFLRAAVEQQLDHRDRAITLLRSVIALEPRNARAYFVLGQNLQQSGKDAEAVSAWKQSLRIDPNYTESLYALFRALAKSNPEESKAYGARFTDLKKQNQVVSRAETLSNFALASVAAKDFAKAISQLQEALQICGDCVSKADLHKNLGLIECQSGDLVNGEQELRTALKDKPDDQDIQKALKIIDDLRRAPAR
jgi:tetratricopeptide (TPR) repeat protein